MKLRKLGKAAAVTAMTAMLITSGFTGCGQAEADDDCLNKSTFVGKSGARHILTVQLPFVPGPVAVLSETGDGQTFSNSSKLWLGESGTSLYALDGSRVWSIDLATHELAATGKVGSNAGQVAGSDADSTMLVTDHELSSVWIMGETRNGAPVEVQVGRGPGALALGPGRRIAYVANEWDRSLSMVETGVGSYVQGQRSVIVAAQEGGSILVLDGDGRTRHEYTGLPSRILDLAVLPGGKILAATYSEVVVTGDVGTIGDAEIVLSEGLALLDLTSGEVTLRPLERLEDTAHSSLLARPTGMAVVGEDKLVVALPGWGAVGIVDTNPKSERFGEVIRLVELDAHPRWVTAATLEGDWVYLLDTDAGEVLLLSRDGDITRRIPLR
ncbi:MAG: hypothetical protein ABI333_21005 [bacterium]